MDVLEAIAARKSVRAFSGRPVEDDVLNRILDAARRAPSARNGQEWRFVVVSDKAVRERIATEAARQPFIGAAGILLACCAKTDGRIMRCGQAAYPIDVAIAMDHIALAATSLGLGTCWIGSFDEGLVKQILDIPSEVRVVQLMPLGYPVDADPVEKSRLRLDEIIHRERW
jgi:nitroreductase